MGNEIYFIVRVGQGLLAVAATSATILVLQFALLG